MRKAGGGECMVSTLRRAKMALERAIMGGGFSTPNFLLLPRLSGSCRSICCEIHHQCET